MRELFENVSVKKKNYNPDAVLACQHNDVSRHTRGALHACSSRAELAIVSSCGQVRFRLEFPWNLTSRHMAAICTRNRGTDERIRGRALERVKGEKRKMCTCAPGKSGRGRVQREICAKEGVLRMRRRPPLPGLLEM